MKIGAYIKDHFLLLDGGMGTLLQQAGLRPGELPERWNLTHPETVKAIQRDYFDAGSHVVNTNTFGANCLKFDSAELEEIIAAAVKIAGEARAESSAPQEKWIALDIGPCGRMLKPLGDLDFEDAVEIFAKTVRLGVKYGVDLITVETMNDCYETKAALLAVKENCDLPVFVTNAYGEDGKLMTGATPQAMAAMLEGLSADAIGANCSLGPSQLEGVAEALVNSSSLPVILKPNAGMPTVRDGVTEYDVTAGAFAEAIADAAKKGVRIFGGCCGTTPAYIRAVREVLSNLVPVPVTEKSCTLVSSYTHAVEIGGAPVLIGERINPTGKKRFKQALMEGDIDYILNEGIAEEEKGADLLDVNVGLPDIDETAMLKRVTEELQAVCDLPLQLDTSSAKALEAALRRYNGKAMINSVNGKKESLETVLPLVKKYGGVVVALTLDEAGIPDTAEGRLAIARRILQVAEGYGIAKKDIVFDSLAMAVSADPKAALTTLEAVRLIKEELGCHTVLGVSNVSFGLPVRDHINAAYLAAALENGLDAAIMNPGSYDMMRTWYAYRALHGFDENCADYIDFAANAQRWQPAAVAAPLEKASGAGEYRSALEKAICKGLKEQAAALCKEMLAQVEPLALVQNEIIPALDRIGKGFEEKTLYLPQLLMSAEAAKAAFEPIKARMTANSDGSGGVPFVLATVKGDIHDIGKNIVKLLLENYGFAVWDLGRDVPPETVVERAIALRAPLVGLSALMTTTVPAMEETIALLREQAPFVKVIVGGAVLTAEYAAKIGADFYAKDAMETVRIARKLTGEE